MAPPSNRKIWDMSIMPPPNSKRGPSDLSSVASISSNRSFTSTGAVRSPKPAKRFRHKRSVSPAFSTSSSHSSRSHPWHVRDLLHERPQKDGPSSVSIPAAGNNRKQTSDANPKRVNAIQRYRQPKTKEFPTNSKDQNKRHSKQVVDLTKDDGEIGESRSSPGNAEPAKHSRKKQIVDSSSSSSSSGDSSSSSYSSSSGDSSSGSGDSDESIGSISNKAVLGEQKGDPKSNPVRGGKGQAVVTPPQANHSVNHHFPRAISASRVLARPNQSVRKQRGTPICAPIRLEDPRGSKKRNQIDTRRLRTAIRPGDATRQVVSENDGDEVVRRTHPQTGPSRQGMTNTSDQPNGSTHIIFAIDFSASMSTKDVETLEKGRPISRWDAVFLLIEGFVQDQLENMDPAVGQGTVSVFVFNENSKVLLHRCPMECPGEANPLSRSLHAAHKKYTPYGGTSFTTCFKKAFELATTNRTPHENVVFIMVSDGRPGDLSVKPPAPGVPMRATVRRNGVQMPSAGKYLDQLREEFNGFHQQGRLALHFMCLYKEGRPWLTYLADHYKGRFHNPDLMMGADRNQASDTPVCDRSQIMDSNMADFTEDHRAGREYRGAANRNIREISQSETSESDADEIVQMKSGDSLWSVFATISSSVTAMRTGSSQELLERAVTLQDTSPMRRYKATRMVCNPRTNKCVASSGEKVNSRMVRIAQHPFKQGGLRNVYRLRQTGLPHQVAKESRHDISYRERLQFHVQSQKCQDKAISYATAFNNRVNRLRRQRPCRALDDVRRNITVLKSEIYRLKDDLVPGGYRYLAVEPEMKDGIYTKYNGNNGYVKKENSLQCQLAQAFSHFSYRYSEKEEMVVDVQGQPYKFTDPQIHSKSKVYGRGDRGEKGFSDFFRTHKCNGICKAIGLQERSDSRAIGLLGHSSRGSEERGEHRNKNDDHVFIPPRIL